MAHPHIDYLFQAHCVFDQLPREMLEKIFKYTIPTDTNARVESTYQLDIFDVHPFQSSFANKEAPLLLGWVCSRWRTILYSTPLLWTSLTIWCKPSSVRSAHREVSLIKNWLGQSGQQPLTLVFFDNPLMTHDDAGLMIDALISASERWQDVTFVIGAHLLQLLQLVKGATPKLQNLYLTITTRAGWYLHLLEARDAFKDAPQLRTVRLEARAYFPYLTLKLPWDNLSEFVSKVDNGCSMRSAECLLILKNCHNLVSCTFGNVRNVNGDSDPTRQIIHNQLSVLKVTHSLGLPRVFEWLSLPALREIHFTGPVERSDESMLRRMLQSSLSSSPLELATFRPLLGRVDMLALLEIMPSLTAVDVQTGNSPNPLSEFTRFSMPETMMPLVVPSLETLTVRHNQEVTSGDREIFLSTLRVRCPLITERGSESTKHLRTVRLGGSGGAALIDMARVKEERLDVSIKFIGDDEV